jgi:NADPH:quinone reductase-like Zn-dependent oxidoreductase
MTAARYATYGSPREVLRVCADVPVPGGGVMPEDGVLVKVEAAALNASDHKCMAGFYRNTQVGRCHFLYFFVATANKLPSVPTFSCI